MGSPNFKTMNIVRPSFGVELDHSADLSEFDIELLESDMRHAYVDAHEMAKEAMYEAELKFHSIQVQAGYHSGFQIYALQEIDAQDVFNDLRINDSDPYNPYVVFTDLNGYEIDDAGFEEKGAAYAKPVLDEQGEPILNEYDEPTYELVADLSKVTELIESEKDVALHHIAIMAQELGLAPIQGITWTSGISRDHNVNAKEIEKHIIAELLTPQSTPVESPAP